MSGPHHIVNHVHIHISEPQRSDTVARRALDELGRLTRRGECEPLPLTTAASRAASIIFPPRDGDRLVEFRILRGDGVATPTYLNRVEAAVVVKELGKWLATGPEGDRSDRTEGDQGR